MPQKPRTLNTKPRASTRVAERPTTAQRGYGEVWRRTRKQKLAVDPLCEDCRDRGYTNAATEVDHKDGLGPSGPRGHDLDNLRSLCKSCHSRKTVKQDGGFGNAKA